MTGGSSGDEPRRGRVRGGYGRDPRYQPPGPGGRNDPGEDGTARYSSGDLSDLWREPDPWAADARRGLEAGRDSDEPRYPIERRNRDEPGPGDQPRYRDQPRSRDERSYADGRGRSDRDGYGPGPGYGGRESTSGAGRGGRDDDPWPGGRGAPGGPAGQGGPRPEETYRRPVTWRGRDGGPRPARREPDAPTERQRNPRAWHDPAEQPREQELSPRTGNQPRPAIQASVGSPLWFTAGKT